MQQITFDCDESPIWVTASRPVEIRRATRKSRRQLAPKSTHRNAKGLNQTTPNQGVTIF
jgi:hypothetical protein